MKKFKLFNHVFVFRKAKEEANPKDQYFSLTKKNEPENEYKINLFIGFLFTPKLKRNVFAIISLKYSIMFWQVEKTSVAKENGKTFESKNGQLITPLVFKYEIKSNQLSEENANG